MQCSGKVCILIPAYNAESTLGSVLAKTKPLGLDTIVVNDGSLDETGRIALEHGVHLLEHPNNLGKGAALRTGFQYILEKGYDTIITLDADDQHDPSEIPFLLKVFEKVRPDILIGSLPTLFRSPRTVLVRGCLPYTMLGIGLGNWCFVGHNSANNSQSEIAG